MPYDFETRKVDCVACGTIDEPLDTLGALAKGPALFAEALETAAGGHEGWTPQEVAAHLADLEVHRGWRIRKVLTEDNPVIEGVDQEAWVAALRYGDRDVPLALETFAGNRRASLELVRLAGDAALRRPFRHPQLGDLTLGWLLRHTTHHDLAHLRQVAGG